ncbi:MAG: 30S ribosomal protein S9 [Planctomycetales bacterium]|nr:30S ribosomal protein S9 [Planctomycetales bacterium]
MATATTEKVSGANDFLGTGRRKTSVARVRVRPGSGNITINRRPLEEFFKIEQHRNTVLAPLQLLEKQGELDVVIRVNGGGITGQAGACMLGIARALKTMDEACEHALREAGYLTRDSRMKERKKYGLHGARRGTQFSKR